MTLSQDCKTSVKLNVALIVGSSQQGKTLRADVGHKNVIATASVFRIVELKTFSLFFFFRRLFFSQLMNLK